MILFLAVLRVAKAYSQDIGFEHGNYNDYEMKSQEEAEGLLTSNCFRGKKELLNLYNHNMKCGKDFIKNGNLSSGNSLVSEAIMNVARDSVLYSAKYDR